MLPSWAVKTIRRLLAFFLIGTFAIAQTFDVSSVEQVSDPRHSDIKTDHGNLYMSAVEIRLPSFSLYASSAIFAS